MDIGNAIAAQRDFAGALFDQLRHDGLDEPGVTRDPYGAGEQRAHATVTVAAQKLGLRIEHDAAANLYMTLPGRDPTAKPIVVGWHLDSVPHGGNFDGAAGVVAGLIAVAALQSLGVILACDLTVMGIRAEESIWFQVSYIGSRGALGMLPDGALDVRRIDTGRTLAEHIADCGGDPDALRARRRFLDPARLRAYLELHIEQAPSLVAAGRPVAICTGIPGNFRYPDVRIEGSHDHVGLPRRFRRDAAMAGAEFAMALDRVWEEHDANGVPMACTIGRFHTDSASHGMTIVPGTFNFSLDVRAYDETVLADLDRQVDAIIAGIEQRRGVVFHRGTRRARRWGRSIPRSKPRWRRGRRNGHSGAASWQPRIARRSSVWRGRRADGDDFIRNENGSHNPREAMAIDDFLAGASLLTWFLARHADTGGWFTWRAPRHGPAKASHSDVFDDHASR